MQVEAGKEQGEKAVWENIKGSEALKREGSGTAWGNERIKELRAKNTQKKGKSRC